MQCEEPACSQKSWGQRSCDDPSLLPTSHRHSLSNQNGLRLHKVTVCTKLGTRG